LKKDFRGGRAHIVGARFILDGRRIVHGKKEKIERSPEIPERKDVFSACKKWGKQGATFAIKGLRDHVKVSKKNQGTWGGSRGLELGPEMREKELCLLSEGN